LTTISKNNDIAAVSHLGNLLWLSLFLVPSYQRSYFLVAMRKRKLFKKKMEQHPATPGLIKQANGVLRIHLFSTTDVLSKLYDKDKSPNTRMLAKIMQSMLNQKCQPARAWQQKPRHAQEQ
jgi:hypothetical protein